MSLYLVCMEHLFDSEAVRIDLSTWERAAVYELFGSFSEPYHGVCLRVDCTETFRSAREQRLSVFLSLMHRALLAMNAVDELKTRIVEGEVWRYRTIHGGSAVGRPNGTIGFGHYPFQSALLPFVRQGMQVIGAVKQRTDLERFPLQNLVRFSVLPWFDFTSISHARDLAQVDSAPRITFGKITEAGGRATMPVSIHVHHGLADGIHVAQFVDRFQDLLTTREDGGHAPETSFAGAS